MSSEFKKAKLVDLCELISRGITPSYTEDIEEGVVVLNQKCIRDNRINFDLARLTNSNKKKVTENKYLRKYDILVNSTGVGTLGRVAQVKKLDKKMTVDSHVTIVRPKAEIDPIYLGYYMFMKQKYIEYLGEGSTGQTELSRVRLGEALEVNFPSLEEQKAIAKVLSDLDEKIETNNKINKKLEEMAQAIFKQWFVDFEFPNEDGKPYKSSGGEMVESELGMIPKGWDSKSLLDIADYLNGLAMQKFRPGDDEKGIPVLKIKELRQGKTDENSDLCSLNIDPKYIIHDGDVIFSWSGSLLVDFWCSGKCGLNQHLFKVTSSKFEKWFYYLWTKYHLDKFIRIAKDKATTMGHIKRADLSNSIVLVPNEVIMNKANLILNPIIEKIIQARIEERKLSQLRDTLLPKLMSGEIRVALEN